MSIKSLIIGCWCGQINQCQDHNGWGKWWWCLHWSLPPWWTPHPHSIPHIINSLICNASTHPLLSHPIFVVPHGQFIPPYAVLCDKFNPILFKQINLPTFLAVVVAAIISSILGQDILFLFRRSLILKLISSPIVIIIFFLVSGGIVILGIQIVGILCFPIIATEGFFILRGAVDPPLVFQVVHPHPRR